MPERGVAVSLVVVTPAARRVYVRVRGRAAPLLSLVLNAPGSSTPASPAGTSVADSPSPSPSRSTPPTTTAATPPTTTSRSGGGSAVIAAAGDVACDPGDPGFNGGNGSTKTCHEKQTAALVESINPQVVLGLGDMQYEDGQYSKYLVSYGPTWGAFKNTTYPTPGAGHDAYATPSSGYCQFFGSNGCPNGRTWYSLDVGAWHLVSLDGDCTTNGGCGAGSPEEQWLRSDLAAHPAKCTLAWWHFPRWSIGEFPDDPRTDTFVRDLDAAGADVILTGHDHIYERFAPQTPDGVAASNGIREFVVGTGGKNHLPPQYSMDLTHPNLEVANADTFGVLKLTLRPTSYEWEFVPDPGSPGSFSDSGSTACH